MNEQKEKEWNILDLADRATIYANSIPDNEKDEHWDWGAVRDLKFAELVRADERTKCAKDYLQDCVRAVEKEREESAKHYLQIMRDAVEQAILKEREACAKECESIGQHNFITMCAAAIRGRTE
jgi:hypothetical protein